MLCRVAAVKSLPVHHHSADNIYLLWDHWAHSEYFENRIPLKPVLVGDGWGAYAVSQITVLHMKILNKTGSPIFIVLCVLCFQRQSFRFLLVWSKAKRKIKKGASLERNGETSVRSSVSSSSYGVWGLREIAEHFVNHSIKKNYIRKAVTRTSLCV